MQRNDLKEKIIKLLKEDEEFKYTVAGLIGYDTIVDRLEEHDRKFNAIIEEVRSIKGILEEHSKRFIAIEERLEEHDRKFNEIINRLEEHSKRFIAIEERLEEHSKKLQELSIGFGSIGRRTGKGLERLILNLYKDKLIELGIDPSKARRYEFIDYEGRYGLKGKRYEFDIVITNTHIDILEVKSHLEEDDIISFYEKVNSIKELLIKEFNNVGRLVAVAIDIDEEALSKAEELDIKVVYGYIIPLEY